MPKVYNNDGPNAGICCDAITGKEIFVNDKTYFEW
jgi:hypothetical protein